MARALRVVRRTLVASLVVYLLLVLALRFETFLYRRQAERLMADIKALQLDKSSWADAKILMTRWGRYGRYDGDCDSSFCRYSIDLQSPLHRLVNNRFGFYAGGNLPIALAVEYNGQVADLRAHFAVQDGIVRRKSASFWYVTPRTIDSVGDASLIAVARADSRVAGPDGWNWGQLADHPYFVVTRPGGCTFCLMAKVTFAVDTPTDEANRLLTFNLSCLTKLLPCKYLEDVYPPAEPWHMYDGTIGGRPAVAVAAEPSLLMGDCRVPLFARRREAVAILGVTSLSERTVVSTYEDIELASVRLDSIVSGNFTKSPGDRFDVAVDFTSDYSPPRIQIPLTPGGHFLLVIPPAAVDKVNLRSCMVVPDSENTRAELTQPSATAVTMRVPDPEARTFVPW